VFAVGLDVSAGSIQRKDGEIGAFETQPLSFNLLLTDRFLRAMIIIMARTKITPRIIPTIAPGGKPGEAERLD
jgi:hypothetical protein